LPSKPPKKQLEHLTINFFKLDSSSRMEEEWKHGLNGIPERRFWKWFKSEQVGGGSVCRWM